MEVLLEFLSSLLNALIPHYASKHGKQSETRKMYEDIRRKIAAALTMNACYYYNPIDIAKTKDHRLPDDYSEGSHKLRELASELRALSETMPEKVRDMPISKKDMYESSRYLIGLSNSFTTPYDMERSAEEYRSVHNYENELRRLLKISEDQG